MDPEEFWMLKKLKILTSGNLSSALDSIESSY
jgi:hypothetical protein